MVRALREHWRITYTMATPETRRQLLAAVAACEDKKGEDTRILELDPADSGLADFFLITSASNDRQVVAIADEIEMRLKKEFGLYPASVEGRRQAEWILLDYVDIVIHVFLAEKRAFYDIERLRKSARPLTGSEVEAELKHELARKTLDVRKSHPAVSAKSASRSVSKSASKSASRTGKKAAAKLPPAPKAPMPKSSKGDSTVSAKPAKKKPAKKAAPKKVAAKKAAPKPAAAKKAAKAPAKKAAAKKVAAKAAPAKKAAVKAPAKPAIKAAAPKKAAAKSPAKGSKAATKVPSKSVPTTTKPPGKRKPPTVIEPVPIEAVASPTPTEAAPAPQLGANPPIIK